MNKFEVAIITALIAIFIGWIGGLYFANWFWRSAKDQYIEAKHQYEYCPYCGEYIGE